MAMLTLNELRGLAEARAGRCASIYLPTHRHMPDTRQDEIRFKNLLGQAEERLVAAGARGADARAMLAPGYEWLGDRQFWQHQAGGLAAFYSRNETRFYRLPLAFQELVVVGERFHLKPLLPLFSGDGRFYVLALSVNVVRLLEGSRHSIHVVPAADLPQSLADALRYDDPERQLQFHTGTGDLRSSGAGGRAAVFHGQGVGVDDAKDRLLRYFRQIDGGLEVALHNQRAPLVLAGVDSHFAIYREANTYRNLLGEGIPGNPESLSDQELHRRAWQIVEPVFQKAQCEEFELHCQARGSPRYSNTLSSVVPAAYGGRVASLFVALHTQNWGTFEPRSGVVCLLDGSSEGALDLLDFAAVQVLSHGGAVHAVEPSQVPNGETVSAILRY